MTIRTENFKLQRTPERALRTRQNLESFLLASACSVAVSYKPPMLVNWVRLPACAYFFAGCSRLQKAAGD